MSNRESSSPYRPDPRRDERFGGAPGGRRGRYSGRGGSAGGGPSRGQSPRYPAQEPGDFPGADRGGDGGWGWQRDEDPAAGDSGGPFGRFGGEPGGRSLRGRHGGGNSGLRGQRRARARQPWQRGGDRDQNGMAGRGGTSARDRYAAARERYAARRGANGAAGAGYRGEGYPDPGHDGAGYDSPGYEGAGYRGTADELRRRLGRAGGRRPGVGAGVRGPGGSGGNGWGGGRGGHFRRKGDWWRHWTLKKAMTVLAAAAGAFTMLATAGVGMAYAQTPIPDPQTAATQAASTVYFSDGTTMVGKFGTYDRQKLTLAQIPKVLQDAVVAAEDKNFYHEGGISPTGILRAAYYDLTSSGGNLQGASTITQQLVRNYYDNIGTAQTLTRKIKEIFVAQKLAQQKSKQWILEQYLNTVYFGDGAYGVGAAAQTYFGLTPLRLHKITAAQAAMIASMIQQPSYYSPNPKDGARYQGLVFRWKYVLGAMVKMGTLSQQGESAALKKFPTVVKSVNNSWAGYNGYVMNAVLYELQHTYHYSQHTIFNGGLRVITTFSQHLMKSLYATVRANRVLMKHATPPSPPGGPTVACGAHGCLPHYVHIGALLEDPANGAVLAMYSGPNYNTRQYDDALQSRNQVGSSFKPYVLATAVSQGMNVKTSHLNGYSPLWIPPDSQPTTLASLTNQHSASWYRVTNDETVNPDRPVSVADATAMSLNTAYADLWHRVALNPATGQHNVVNMAKSFGVDTGPASGLWKMRDEAGSALGQASLTVEEQANMIATLANGGEYHTPHVIKKIIDGANVIQARILSHQVLTPDQAAEVDYAMSFDMGALGTANGLGLTNGQTVIAKTGTTNLSQSAFFLGATPRYAMAVGMFVNHPGCTLPASQQYLCQSTGALAYTPPAGLETLFGVGGLAGYGGQWPAIIWHDFYMKEFNSLPVEAWPALPANFGSPWNLAVQPPKPKLRPHPTPPSHPCEGNSRKCQPSPGPSPSPVSTCPPAPLPCPSATATATATAAAAIHGTAGGLVAGGLVAGGLATGGLAAGWLPGRRRRPRPLAGGQDE